MKKLRGRESLAAHSSLCFLGKVEGRGVCGASKRSSNLKNAPVCVRVRVCITDLETFCVVQGRGKEGEEEGCENVKCESGDAFNELAELMRRSQQVPRAACE